MPAPMTGPSTLLQITANCERLRDPCSCLKEACCSASLVVACDKCVAEVVSSSCTLDKLASEASQLSLKSSEVVSKENDLAVALRKDALSALNLSSCLCKVRDRSSSKLRSSFSTIKSPSKLFSKASGGAESDEKPYAGSDTSTNEQKNQFLTHYSYLAWMRALA